MDPDQELIWPLNAGKFSTVKALNKRIQVSTVTARRRADFLESSGALKSIAQDVNWKPLLYCTFGKSRFYRCAADLKKII